MHYIKYKDKTLCKINYKTGEVEINTLPLNIYLEESTDIDDKLNNIYNFNFGWDKQ